uniref:EF-hand domain-containing protein n=1 Tax=Odontella aurita TaxID=265563 RepID=A0A7S4NE72_9STRA|mmetsp:Transcript_60095/g.178185  ORF Transcript_60095/g.178185 Transcript_60095/m.178185 type:complete len:436 (+) Transcript_60095:194-1501(+)
MISIASTCRSAVFRNRHTLRPLSRGGRPKSNVADKQDLLDVNLITEQMGVRLTKNELALLSKKFARRKDGKASIAELRKASQNKLDQRATRELCLGMIEQPTTKWDQIGHKFIHFLHFFGSAMFAVVGTQVAGDSGMNIVGCSLVGCIAAMGGGTLNNILYGSSSTLLGRSGVFWVQIPSKLAGSIAASVITFFAWPLYCEHTSAHYLEDIIGKDNLNKAGKVDKEAFCLACEKDPHFLENVRSSLKKDSPRVRKAEPAELFNHIDTDGSGDIDQFELKEMIQRQFDSSPITYAIDTVALASLCVVGVHGALVRGFHPIVTASSGITVCFGGIMRDVLCGRDLALGGQSYAFATGMGSTVYVFLRQLSIMNIPVPLFARIFAGAGTVIGIRYWEFVMGKPLLSPMHGWQHPPTVGRKKPVSLSIVPKKTTREMVD